MQNEKNEDDVEEYYQFSLWDYLDSENGKKSFDRLLNIIEDIKKFTIEKNSEAYKFEKKFQIIIIGLIISTSSVLTYCNKFDSTLGLLFGTLVGYMFGKK